MLVDAHCHLDFDELSQDMPGVMERADRAGVGMMLTISTKLSTFPDVRAIAEKHDNVYCTVGIHPHHSEDEGLATPEQLLMYAEHPKVVGIGECGLDYHYDDLPSPQVQKKQFENHIEASRQGQLPLMIHARDADNDMIDMLVSETKNGVFPFILHCFSSGEKLAKTGLDLGGYISFSGIVTFKKSDELRDIAKNVPLSQMLVETDAPYLAPQPVRGKPCEPSYVVHTAHVLSELKQTTYADIEKHTTENFLRLFGKVIL